MRNDAARTRTTTKAIVPLETLADTANAEHTECLGCLRSGLDHARAAGGALVEAKNQVAHGEWLSWLGENFRAEPQTASGYMRIASRWKELEQNENGVFNLTYREALKLLSTPHESDKPLAQGQSLPLVTGEKPEPAEVHRVQPDGEPVEATGSRIMTVAEYEASDAPEDDTPETPRPPRGVGIRMAHEAINILGKIPPGDPFRQDGLRTVAQWIKANA